MDTSERQQLYQRWKATPRAMRRPDQQTEEDVARILRVDLDTLRAWEQQPDFWLNVFSYARTILGSSLPSVLEALVKKAQSGSVTAIKLVLEVLDLHVDKIEQRVKREDDRLVVILSAQDEEPAARPPPAE